MQRTAVTSSDAPSLMEDADWDDVVRKGAVDPADLMLRREYAAMIQQALYSLPVACRTAVELCDIEGLPCERISEIMACPLETVQSRIHQGHLLMKKALEEIEAGAKKPH